MTPVTSAKNVDIQGKIRVTGQEFRRDTRDGAKGRNGVRRCLESAYGLFFGRGQAAGVSGVDKCVERLYNRIVEVSFLIPKKEGVQSMDKSKKIMIAGIVALAIISAVSMGMLIGTRMNKSAPAEAPLTEAITQAEPIPVPTEAFPEHTEPAPELYEPDEIATAAPTIPTQPPVTQAPVTRAQTTRVQTTRAQTTRAQTTKAPVTQAPATQTPTTQAPTTAKPTTTKPATTKPATTRASAYSVIITPDAGTYDISGNGRYSAGEFVKVSMTPRLGYKFIRWESSDKKVLADSTAQTYIFQMPASGVTLRAVTKAQVLLTVNKGKGIAYASSSGYYAPGEKVSVTAQLESGYEFAGWSSSSGTGTPSAGLTSTSQTFSFTMPDRPITLTASAKAKTYTLRVNVGTGVRSVTGAGKYSVGDKVTLNVYMKDNYTLNRWSDLNATYNGNTVTFTMPARDLTLTATGKTSEKYLVSLGLGEGVRDVQGSGMYAPGDTVTINCTIDNGYKFSMWESENSYYVSNSKNRVYAFTMPAANISLTARAEKEQQEETKYLVGIELGEGIYNVSGSGYYAPGERVTVDCTPRSGYSFSSWTIYSPSSVEEVSTQRYTFIMPRGEMRLIANAKENEQVDFG